MPAVLPVLKNFAKPLCLKLRIMAINVTYGVSGVNAGSWAAYNRPYSRASFAGRVQLIVMRFPIRIYSLHMYTAPPTATTETAVAVIVTGDVRIASPPAPIDANVPAI